jgi:hypothetical protein
MIKPRSPGDVWQQHRRSASLDGAGVRASSWFGSFPGRSEVVAGCAASAAIIAVVTIRAIVDPVAYDIGLAYAGGQVALATGHPETLTTWIGTPFFAMVMAAVSKLLSLQVTAVVLNLTNGAALVALITAVWVSLRRAFPRWLWWGSLLGAALFAPAISSLWWKQMNIVCFALAALGWWLLRRERDRWVVAAFLIALSVMIKPIVLVVPVALLLRRDTRRAGYATAIWATGMLVLSQAFLAWRAHSLAALSPIPAVTNFAAKSPPASTWLCVPENFSPASMLCRLGETTSFAVIQRVTVVGGVAALAWLALRSVRTETGRSWRVFGYACALSAMISPVAWSHYQLLLAPLLLLVAHDLYVHGGSAPAWVALALGFLLAELVWQPYGTLPQFANLVLRGVGESAGDKRAIFAVAEFAQYVVLATALVRFSARPRLEQRR